MDAAAAGEWLVYSWTKSIDDVSSNVGQAQRHAVRSLPHHHLPLHARASGDLCTREVSLRHVGGWSERTAPNETQAHAWAGRSIDLLSRPLNPHEDD